MTSALASIITIDGPSGAGKGTVAKRLAASLGWHLLDSGALYRLVAISALRRQVAVDDEAQLSKLAAELDVVFEARSAEENVCVLLEGVDVSKQIRTEEVGAVASQVAALASVRDALLQRQRQFALAPGLIADGRDMGTVVFVEAPLKIFLTASVEERAQRRMKQLAANSALQSEEQSDTLARLVETIAARDKSDMERVVAPLRPADDAVVIDSTDMSIDQVCDQVLREARQRKLVN